MTFGPSPTVMDDAPSSEARVIEAAHRCFGRWGVSKTTVDDIGREAGLSRATVYRIFPAGRDAIVEAVVSSQRNEFFEQLGSILKAAESLEEMLVTGMREAWTSLATDEVLAYLVEHEPALVLQNLAFEKLEELIASCREVLVPYVTRWLDERRASQLAEWATRVVVSYAIAPPDWLGLPASRGEDAQTWAATLAETVVSTFFLPVLADWGVPVSKAPSTSRDHDFVSVRGAA